MQNVKKLDPLAIRTLLSKVGGRVVGAILFLAAVAQILLYLEQSNMPPKVATLLSPLVSPETLDLAYRLLFLFAVAVGFWWLGKRIQVLEEHVQEHVLGGGRATGERAVLASEERGELRIRSAMYGLGPGYELDIAVRVQALVKNGELHVRVWPDDLGVCPDLYEGKPKTLRVRYSYDGKEVKEIACKDLQILHIPQRDRE